MEQLKEKKFEWLTKSDIDFFSAIKEQFIFKQKGVDMTYQLSQNLDTEDGKPRLENSVANNPKFKKRMSMLKPADPKKIET